MQTTDMFVIFLNTVVGGVGMLYLTQTLNKLESMIAPFTRTTYDPDEDLFLQHYDPNINKWVKSAVGFYVAMLMGSLGNGFTYGVILIRYHEEVGVVPYINAFIILIPTLISVWLLINHYKMRKIANKDHARILTTKSKKIKKYLAIWLITFIASAFYFPLEFGIRLL